ncbi:MAG TPA: hypothetical protein VGR10_02385 [Thermoleophilaceae bacterium]|nr:hypothetical protein [Thermoleophilaceae bacterium]
MAGEERQRTLRRAGSEPAEAEKQEGARESRERKAQKDAEAAAAQDDRGEEHTPLAEDPGDQPRPRR